MNYSYYYYYYHYYGYYLLILITIHIIYILLLLLSSVLLIPSSPYYIYYYYYHYYWLLYIYICYIYIFSPHHTHHPLCVVYQAAFAWHRHGCSRPPDCAAPAAEPSPSRGSLPSQRASHWTGVQAPWRLVENNGIWGIWKNWIGKSAIYIYMYLFIYLLIFISKYNYIYIYVNICLKNMWRLVKISDFPSEWGIWRSYQRPATWLRFTFEWLTPQLMDWTI